MNKRLEYISLRKIFKLSNKRKEMNLQKTLLYKRYYIYRRKNDTKDQIFKFTKDGITDDKGIVICLGFALDDYKKIMMRL